MGTHPDLLQLGVGLVEPLLGLGQVWVSNLRPCRVWAGFGVVAPTRPILLITV